MVQSTRGAVDEVALAQVLSNRGVSDTDVPSTIFGPNRYGIVVVGGFGLHIHVADAHLIIRTRDEGELRLRAFRGFDGLSSSARRAACRCWHYGGAERWTPASWSSNPPEGF